MARFEVWIDEGKTKAGEGITRVEAVEAVSLYWREDGTLVFCGEGKGMIRAFAAGCWQQVRKIEEPEDEAADRVIARLPDAEVLAAAAMICTRYAWTNNPPRVPGYYWLQPLCGGPDIVQVAGELGTKGGLTYGAGEDDRTVEQQDFKWCGPIPEPVEAVKQPVPPPPPGPEPRHIRSGGSGPVASRPAKSDTGQVDARKMP